MGWIKDPKKATYNYIYNKTTIGIDQVVSQKRNVNQNYQSNQGYFL